MLVCLIWVGMRCMLSMGCEQSCIDFVAQSGLSNCVFGIMVVCFCVNRCKYGKVTLDVALWECLVGH